MTEALGVYTRYLQRRLASTEHIARTMLDNGLATFARGQANILQQVIDDLAHIARTGEAPVHREMEEQPNPDRYDRANGELWRR